MIVDKLQFLLGKRTIAFTLWPFIFVKKGHKNDEIMINHEKIHLKQQKELLIIGFIIWYFVEFLIHYIKYRNFMKAYFSISFEKEAYTNQNNSSYLRTRKLYSFLKYL